MKKQKKNKLVSANMQSIQEKVKSYLEENKRILEKYKMSINLVINFPLRKRVPLLSRIAMKIVNKQGGILDMQFIDDKKT